MMRAMGCAICMLAAALPGCAAPTALGPSDGGSASSAAAGEEVIELTARQWSYEPASITLHKGVPALLRLHSEDVHHGFNLPELGIRADVLPGKTVELRVVPAKAGTFSFYCDYYCGSGHEGMTGQVIVQ